MRNGEADAPGEFFDLGLWEVFLFGDAEDAGNATAPFLDQLQFAKHAGDDGISDLGDALLNVLDRQAGEEEARAFDLDSVVKKATRMCGVGGAPIGKNLVRNRFLLGFRSPRARYRRGARSNTTFEFSDIKAGGTPLTVTATVKNTGTRAGDEVAQLYLTPPESDATWPRLMLRGFQRVTLQPGESKQLRFDVPDEKLAFWRTETKRFDVARGDWGVRVGASSSDIRLQTRITR